MEEGTFSISELASQFNITTRTIRYYEEKGLLDPTRSDTNYRIYTSSDKTRLRLIVRGKRFGLSLEEISQILGPSEFENSEVEQLKAAIEYGEKYLVRIRDNINELRALEADLIKYGLGCVERLSQLGEKTEFKALIH